MRFMINDFAMRLSMVVVLVFCFPHRGNSRWEPTGDLIGKNDITVLAASSGKIAASNQFGQVFVSSDTGASWTMVLGEFNDALPISSIVFENDSLVVACGGDHPYLIFKNQSAWQYSGLRSVKKDSIKLLLESKGTIFAGADSGLFSTIDLKKDWTPVDSSALHGSVSALIAHGDGIVAGFSNGGLFISLDNGLSWNPIDSGLPKKRAIDNVASIGKTLWAGVVGRDGDSQVRQVFLSIDSGKLWKTASAPFDRFSAMTVIGSTLFAGGAGGVWKSVDSGANWQKLSLGQGDSSVAALTAIGNYIFAGMQRSGGIVRSLDGGASWTMVSSDLTNKDARCLLVNGDKVFAGTEKFVFASADGGAHWSGRDQPFYSVRSMAVKDSLIIAGTGIGWGTSGIYYSSDNGITWNTDKYGPTVAPITSIVVKGSFVFAGMDGYEGMFRSNNGKTSWTQMNNGLIVYHGISSYNVNVFAVGVVGNTVVAGTDEGIYYSDSDGVFWDSAGFATNVRCFAAANPVMFAAAEGKGALASWDFGRTWKSVDSGLGGKSILSLTAKGKNVFAGAEAGHVFFTANYGMSWAAIDSGLPAADVLSLAIMADTLYAGLKGKGVWRLVLTGATPALSREVISRQPLDARLLTRHGVAPLLRVTCASAKPERVVITLFNPNGTKIATLCEAFAKPGGNVLEFLLPERASGFYVVRVAVGAKSVSKNLIITR